MKNINLMTIALTLLGMTLFLNIREINLHAISIFQLKQLETFVLEWLLTK